MLALRSSCRTLLTNQNHNYVTNRNIKRWVAPTLKILKKRKDKMGPQPPEQRSKFIEWNYHSELFAFANRLNEQFDKKLLQQAFTNRSYIIKAEMKQQEVGIENPDTLLNDNRILIEKGEQIINEYVMAFLLSQLPRFPIDGIKAIHNYLITNEMLAHISSNLGTSDLILSSEYPPDELSLANTLKAIIGTLENNNGNQQAYNFVRDFICTQLNQKDINEIWEIYNPMGLLQEICKDKGMSEPEPRLIHEAGKNTILVTYHIGIYCDKKYLGSGFGENINNGIEIAARNCLSKLFGTDNLRPFNYKITVNECFSTAHEHKQHKLG